MVVVDVLRILMIDRINPSPRLTTPNTSPHPPLLHLSPLSGSIPYSESENEKESGC